MLLVCCWYVAVIILGEYILDLGAQDAGPNHQDGFFTFVGSEIRNPRLLGGDYTPEV